MKMAKLNHKFYGLVEGVIDALRFDKSFPEMLNRLKQNQDGQRNNLVLWDKACEEWLSDLLSKGDKTYLSSHVRKIAISAPVEDNGKGALFTMIIEPYNPLYSISNYEIRLTADPIRIDSVSITYDGKKVQGDNLVQLLSWCE